MTCPTTPGTCDTCGRRVRWADLQSCRSNGPPGTPPNMLRAQYSHPKSGFQSTCRDCIHRGDPILAANGKQVGTEGCGCTGEAAPSGVLWWTCGLTGNPVRESRADRCEDFTLKGS